MTKEKLITKWGNIDGYPSYTALLNSTLFCPQPMGTTGMHTNTDSLKTSTDGLLDIGWTTRLMDSIYAGCVPVLIGNTVHQPFFDMIDWGKISVRIEFNEVDRLEEILLSRYSMDDVERFQANMMVIRDAFLYPLDDVDDATVRRQIMDERGPLFFALHSTRMRMLTRWPVGDEGWISD